MQESLNLTLTQDHQRESYALNIARKYKCPIVTTNLIIYSVGFQCLPESSQKVFSDYKKKYFAFQQLRFLQRKIVCELLTN